MQLRASNLWSPQSLTCWSPSVCLIAHVMNARQCRFLRGEAEHSASETLASWEPSITAVEHWDTGANGNGDLAAGSPAWSGARGRAGQGWWWDSHWWASPVQAAFCSPPWWPCTWNWVLGSGLWALHPAEERADGAGNGKWGIPGCCDKETGMLGTLHTQEANSLRESWGNLLVPVTP